MARARIGLGTAMAVAVVAACGGEEFGETGGDTDASSGAAGAATAGATSAGGAGGSAPAGSGGDGAVSASGAAGNAGGTSTVDGSVAGGAAGSAGAAVDAGDDTSAGGSAGAGGAGIVCAGTHPLVSAGARYCEPGSCYCSSPDACFEPSIARACCSVEPSCAGVCPEGLPGPDLVRIPIVGTQEGYCIDRSEVTRAQYTAFLLANPSPSGQRAECSWNIDFFPNVAAADASLPVVAVDWCDASAYCAWAGKRLCGAIGGGSNPPALWASESASQWYNACAGGGATSYPYGNSYVGGACIAWDYDGTPGWQSASDVLRPAASAVTCEGGFEGVYDLSGNAWEWEDSCAGANRDAACQIRGGAYIDGPTDAACGSPKTVARDARISAVGFRCCAELVPP